MEIYNISVEDLVAQLKLSTPDQVLHAAKMIDPYLYFLKDIAEDYKSIRKHLYPLITASGIDQLTHKYSTFDNRFLVFYTLAKVNHAESLEDLLVYARKTDFYFNIFKTSRDFTSRPFYLNKFYETGEIV